MEQYQGIKFDVTFLQKKIPGYPIQEELMKWGRILAERRCIPTYPNLDDTNQVSSAGNLSARVGDLFIITAAGSNLRLLTSEDFVEIVDVDIFKKRIQAIGVKSPSSETMLHYSIYQKRKDVHVVFHGHHQEMLSKCEKLGLSSTEKWYPYGTCELVDSVCKILDHKDMIVIMKDHGFLSFGKTCQQAGKNVIRVLFSQNCY